MNREKLRPFFFAATLLIAAEVSLKTRLHAASREEIILAAFRVIISIGFVFLIFRVYSKQN